LINEDKKLEPTDWVKALIDGSAKWTERSLATAVGTSQPTIHRIYKGSMPLWKLGEKIKHLYQSEIGCL